MKESKELNTFKLENLEVYQLALALSKTAWKTYQNLSWEIKKTAGSQFIESADSIGANIAEGYGRFHYSDRIKFLYNARGSLLESRHWFNLLSGRKLIDENLEKEFLAIYKKLRPKLNALIQSIYRNKNLPNTK